MNLEEIKTYIINGVNKKWPTLYKIRYVYLMFGKYLSKDTDFFFSVEQKLGSLNMSIDEIEKVYNSLEGRDLNVICLSASFILKEIYDKLGIKSKLVKSKNNISEISSNNKTLYINHYILAVEDENNTYFTSLASDLPFIQENMKTRHFANHIPYIMNLSNNRSVQVYEGEEIDATVLDDNILKEIDNQIGYLELSYSYKNNDFTKDYNDTALLILKDYLKNNKLYYNLLIENSSLYNKLYNFNIRGKNLSFFNNYLSDLSKDDIESWIFILCYNISDEISKKKNITIDKSMFTNSFSYDKWIKYMCKLLSKYLYDEKDANDFIIDDNFNYSNFSKNIKKKYNYNSYDLDNLLDVLDKSNALVNYVKSDNQNGKFNDLLHQLCFHFINKDFVLEQKEYADNLYIANKLRVLFPYIFSTNEIRLPFNNRSYSEQIVIIKEILEIMFNELNTSNSIFDGYNYKYSPVQNRIQIYAVKNKTTLEYKIIFNIIGDNKSGDYYFLYDPKANTFNSVNILKVYQDNIIVSNRLKSILEDIDDEFEFKKR